MPGVGNSKFIHGREESVWTNPELKDISIS